MQKAKSPTHNIRQLRLRHKVLRLRSDQFLLQRHELCALGLLALQLRNLVRNLSLAIPARLHALLGVADLLQRRAGIVHRMRIPVLLLAHLGHDDADLVADIADSLVTSLLAPFGQLGADGHALAACGLVRRDQVVGRLDQLVELAGQLGLDGAAQRGEAEADAVRARRGAGPAVVLTRADGEGAIPVTM